MLSLFFVVTIAVSAVLSTCAAPLEDIVVDLPLFEGKLPTTHFSGFIDGTEGCHPDNGKCRLHYWLAMAKESGSNFPIVLWQNGGPGASSVIGMLQEHGPFLLNRTGNGFVENPYSWNKLAHLLILEAPVGVGYSYCDRQIESNLPCINTDRYSASTSRAALSDFFRKFPELQENDLYLTGESYAGVYLPTLALEILQHNKRLAKADQDQSLMQAKPIQLAGMAVGDPCTDNNLQKLSKDPLWYSHKYGLIDDHTFHLLWDHCRNSDETRNNHTLMQLCTAAERKFLLASSHGLSNPKHWENAYLDKYSFYSHMTRSEEEGQLQVYMERPDVRAALHGQDSPVTGSWPTAQQGWDYTKEYDACNHVHVAVKRSMIDFYRAVAPHVRSIYVYNGDADPTISYEGTRVAIEQVGFPVLPGRGYRPWFYNHTAADPALWVQLPVNFGPDLTPSNIGPQFGGEVINYAEGLTFLTVHGSGHLVPQSRPQASFHMLAKLLSGQPLAPHMPTDEDLAAMSNQEFEAFISSWTLEAQSAPFCE